MNLSIIIPTYNAQQTLIRCIESILSHNNLLLEIIIVDDGSLDNTLNIAYKLQQKYRNIVVLSQHNAGPSSARKLGLSYATGCYITFVDSDDFLDKHCYDNLYHILDKTNVDLLEFGYKNVTEKGFPFSVYHKQEIYLKNEKIYEQFMIASNRTNPLWNKICKRELLYNIDFPDYKMGEDLCVTVQIMYNAKSYIYVDVPYYNYVHSPKGLTGIKKLKSYQDDIESSKYVYTFTKNRVERLADYPLSYLIGKLIDADIFVSGKFGINSDQHKEFLEQFKYYFSLIKLNKENYKLYRKFYIYKYLGVHCYSIVIMFYRNIVKYCKCIMHFSFSQKIKLR